MHWWLQGGPFLEVSFLLELKEMKKESIQEVIFHLSKVDGIEIYDKNVDEIIDFFVRGYPYDEEDPQSNYIHSLRLRLYVSLTRKRKATLQIDKVSSNAIMVNFWFDGTEIDEPDWDRDEFEEFTNFHKILYSVYEFKIGGIAVEEDILELFGCDETYPNECYRYENISPDRFLRELSHFESIIWNEKYEKLTQIPNKHIRLEKEGIFIRFGSIHN
ncbi:hypothetical protein [Ornithinibacillus halophilus]|uniref:Uncharacterized protein n=1 Tax=Ornithinibacillus halophilus TaxID=930117 RepID=A0A1M5KWB3_9BACI|nr:hypothetical protein [Ornithinibacillus halophilus]SHG56453.1 hypothetical protein SAMN05216225_104125 [Ornithinibacillus halophilus]